MQSQSSKIIIALIIVAIISGGGAVAKEPSGKVTELSTESQKTDDSSKNDRGMQTDANKVSISINKSEIIQSLKLKDYLYDNFSGPPDVLLSNTEALLVSGDAQENKSESCLDGYLSGSFNLVFRDVRNQKIIDQVDLGNIDVPQQALHVNYGVYGESSPGYFVIVKHYGSCNGNLFGFYSPPTEKLQKIRKASFSDMTSNELFAASFDKITLEGEILEANYYDNVSASNKTKIYTWSGDIDFELEKK